MRPAVSIRTMKALAVACAAILLAVMSPAACGDDPITVADRPPWGLSEIALPDDAGAVEATMAALPDELAGEPRQLGSDDWVFRVTYEEPLEGMPSVQAFEVAALGRQSPEGTDLTAFETMAIYLQAAAEEVDPGGVYSEIEQVSMDPTEALVWATGLTIENETRAPSVTFADPDGGWIFTVMASTPELRVELVEAFCAAASS